MQALFNQLRAEPPPEFLTVIPKTSLWSNSGTYLLSGLQFHRFNFTSDSEICTLMVQILNRSPGDSQQIYKWKSFLVGFTALCTGFLGAGI